MLDSLAQGFRSGSVIDALMLLLCAEGLVLAAVFRQRGVWNAVIDAACIVVPGVFLMGAVKLALTDADWRWIAIALAAAGMVHAWDVMRRIRA